MESVVANANTEGNFLYLAILIWRSLPPLPHFLEALLLKASRLIKRLAWGQAQKSAARLSAVNHPLPPEQEILGCPPA